MNKIFKQQSNWLLKEKYHGKECKEFFNDLKRLANNEPVDYLIGSRPFLSCIIDLKFKPLIPRDETEFWLKEVMDEIPKEKEINVLDVFCGSGCIGIAILKHFKNSKVVFCDIDEKCLKQSKINAKLNAIDLKRCKCVKRNILSDIKNKKFDYIFAKPPYIPLKYKNKVQKSVLKFEPHKALFGGEDGLLFIKKFLNQCKKHLSVNGVFYMEFDDRTVLALKKELKNHKDFSFQIKKDQYGKPRVLRGVAIDANR